MPSPARATERQAVGRLCYNAISPARCALSDQLFAFEQHFIERRLATLQAKYAALGAFPHEPLVAQLRADDVTRCCTAARVLAEQADRRAILPLAAAYYEYSRDRYG